MGVIVDPFARCRNPLACRDNGSVSDDSDKIAMASGLCPQNTKPVIAVMEGDTLDKTSQHVAIGWRGLNLHGARHTLGFFFGKPGLPQNNC
jgi:hypothetical protein